MNDSLNSKSAITCIRRDLTLEQVNNLGLVLSAAQITYRAVAYQDRWSLWIHEEDQIDAGMALDAYEQENETGGDEGVLDQALWGQNTRSWAGIWAALFLGVCHFGVTSSGKRSDSTGLLRFGPSDSRRRVLSHGYSAVATCRLGASIVQYGGDRRVWNGCLFTVGIWFGASGGFNRRHGGQRPKCPGLSIRSQLHWCVNSGF